MLTPGLHPEATSVTGSAVRGHPAVTVFRSYSPDTEHRVWPWTMGRQYSSWIIPLAIPKKGEADLTRGIPWAGNPLGFCRSNHDRKSQQQTQAGLTLPLLREVVEEPLASSKVKLWCNRRPFADTSTACS